MSDTLKVKAEVELRPDFLGDVLVTAFDGQYGGCWYWAEPYTDNWLETKVFHVDGHDMDDVWYDAYVGWGSEGGPGDQRDSLLANGGHINHKTLAVGMQYVLNGKDAYGKETSWPSIKNAILEQDAGEIDSGDADVIVQLGLMGTVVFG